MSTELRSPWLLNLINAIAQQQDDGKPCNRSHVDSEGCDWCAWQALLDSVPHPVRLAANKALLTPSSPDAHAGTPWDGTESVKPEPDEAYRDHNGRIWVASGGGSAGPRKLYLAGWLHGIEPEDLDKMTRLEEPISDGEMAKRARIDEMGNVDAALGVWPAAVDAGDR